MLTHAYLCLIIFAGWSWSLYCLCCVAICDFHQKWVWFTVGGADHAGWTCSVSAALTMWCCLCCYVSSVLYYYSYFVPILAEWMALIFIKEWYTIVHNNLGVLWRLLQKDKSPQRQHLESIWTFWEKICSTPLKSILFSYMPLKIIVFLHCHWFIISLLCVLHFIAWFAVCLRFFSLQMWSILVVSCLLLTNLLIWLPSVLCTCGFTLFFRMAVGVVYLSLQICIVVVAGS
jgi:hypothetical protein